MNPSNDPVHWTDERLDAVLTDFFHEEMPVELRGSRARPEAARPDRGVRPSVTVARTLHSAAPARIPGRSAGIVVSALCLTMAVALMWGAASDRSTTARPAADPHRPDARVAADRGTAPAVDAPTAAGPVEESIERRTLPASVPGAEADPVLPELEVEIIPIEDEERKP